LTPPILVSSLRKAYLAALSGGIDPLRLWRAAVDAPRFVRDLRSYRRLNRARGGSFPLELRNLFPILGETHTQAATLDRHYFQQDLWVARRVYASRPASHLDVGSRLDGFVAHLLTFMPVTSVDIRALDHPPPGLTFIRDDAVTLTSVPSASAMSVSSLHAVEHFGLGRYGDPLDPDAWRNALLSLERVLCPGGVLYLSLPIGRQRIEFNAQRVFNPRTILGTLSTLRLTHFAAIDDDGVLVDPAAPDDYTRAEFACGLFVFTKEPATLRAGAAAP
jgi:hypothetical protein